MNRCFLLITFSLMFTSCSKNSSDPIANNNEVNITVTHSTGSAITINAKSQKALIGLKSLLGGPGYITGTNTANAAVYVNLYPEITSAGAYNFSNGYRCQYRVNDASPTTPIYESTAVNGGTLNITTLRDDYIEGSFTAVCRNGADSVIVTGTFKGNNIAK